LHVCSTIAIQKQKPESFTVVCRRSRATFLFRRVQAANTGEGGGSAGDDERDGRGRRGLGGRVGTWNRICVVIGIELVLLTCVREQFATGCDEPARFFEFFQPS
jgi:hypothetical protein